MASGSLIHAPAPLLLLLLMNACTVRETAPAVLPVTIANRVYRLELALDDPARIQGLSDRSAIAADGGMLFVFPQAQKLDFVMRRCLVPIDIIFLDPGGRVVKTWQMEVEPPETRGNEERLRRYSSEWPAQFAIELRGETLTGLGLKPGDKIDLPLADLKGRAR